MTTAFSIIREYAQGHQEIRNIRMERSSHMDTHRIAYDTAREILRNGEALNGLYDWSVTLWGRCPKCGQVEEWTLSVVGLMGYAGTRRRTGARYSAMVYCGRVAAPTIGAIDTAQAGGYRGPRRRAIHADSTTAVRG